MTVSLHHGRWQDVFETWPTPCVLVCDPPYGQNYRSSHHHGWKGKTDKCRTLAVRIVGDKDTAERDEAMERIQWSAAAVFGPKRIDKIPPWGDPRDILILDKGGGVGSGDLSFPWKPCSETIAIYGPGWAGPRTPGVLRGTVIAFSADNAPNGRRHPNEKNLTVVRELIAKSPPGLPIVDPFAGSGVVGSAAVLEGRDYFGAEIDEGYYAIASEAIGVTHGPLFATMNSR